MNARELTDKADQLAENGLLKLLGRFLMMVSGPAMIWIGATMWSLSKDAAETKGELKASITQLRGEMAVLRATIEFNMSDRYRATDAARDFKARDQKDAELERRVDKNEVRIDRLERSPR